jgi:protein SCO1/2
MKKKMMLRSPMLPLLATLALAACGGQSEAAPAAEGDHPDHAVTAAHDAALAPADPTEYSLYQVESKWTDQHGEERELESLAGRVQVVAMVYTSCAHACPRLLADMKRIEGEVEQSDPGRVGFVFVTIDPERDTPDRLATYAHATRLGPDAWTLLTAPEPDTRELAALLGVRYHQEPDGEYTHSNLITVLDPEGVVVHRQEGLGADPTATIAAIRKAARAG